jgi:cell division protein FtsQ
LQWSWRTLVVSAVAFGFIWLITRPDWMLRQPSDIIIEGNKSVPTETIRSLLPIKYPQFLLTLQPKTIAQSLESQAAIAGVSVHRNLFPPTLTIQIQERYPVALVYEQTGTNVEPVSLLDDRGNVMNYQNYIALNQSQSLPNLRIISIREAERAKWSTLYQQVSRSPIKIHELNWSNPSNLILQTDLGAIHIGSYTSKKFQEQLRVLDQLRHIPKEIPLDAIAYINLHNPKKPFLTTTGASTQQPLPSSESTPSESEPTTPSP